MATTVTDGAAQARIDRLIDEIEAAAQSPGNRSRGRIRPTLGIGIEEPIAWHHLFGYDVNRYYSDPAFYVEQTLRQKLWRFHTIDDDVPLTLEIPAWLGHYPEYTFVGMTVSFDRRGVPVLQEDHPLSRDPDLRLLAPVDFASSGWMPRVRRWYEEVSAIAGSRLTTTFNMGWWRGCLDLAIQLRGYAPFVGDTVERPGFAHGLLSFLVEQRCRWHEAYVRHYGLQLGPTGVADDWINVPFISPQLFADFVLPRYLEIERFHGGIAGVHSCGNQAPVQRYLLEIRTLRHFEVSPWTDLEETLRNVPADRSLGVSMHPNDVLCASSEQMEAKLRRTVLGCTGRQYSIHTSGLTPITEQQADYVASIDRWLRIARRVRAEGPTVTTQ
jgi:hypothetical protein